MRYNDYLTQNLQSSCDYLSYLLTSRPEYDADAAISEILELDPQVDFDQHAFERCLAILRETQLVALFISECYARGLSSFLLLDKARQILDLAEEVLGAKENLLSSTQDKRFERLRQIMCQWALVSSNQTLRYLAVTTFGFYDFRKQTSSDVKDNSRVVSADEQPEEFSKLCSAYLDSLRSNEYTSNFDTSRNLLLNLLNDGFTQTWDREFEPHGIKETDHKAAKISAMLDLGFEFAPPDFSDIIHSLKGTKQDLVDKIWNLAESFRSLGWKATARERVMSFLGEVFLLGNADITSLNNEQTATNVPFQAQSINYSGLFKLGIEKNAGPWPTDRGLLVIPALRTELDHSFDIFAVIAKGSDLKGRLFELLAIIEYQHFSVRSKLDDFSITSRIIIVTDPAGSKHLSESLTIGLLKSLEQKLPCSMLALTLTKSGVSASAV